MCRRARLLAASPLRTAFSHEMRLLCAAPFRRPLAQPTRGTPDRGVAGLSLLDWVRWQLHRLSQPSPPRRRHLFGVRGQQTSLGRGATRERTILPRVAARPLGPRFSGAGLILVGRRPRCQGRELYDPIYRSSLAACLTDSRSGHLFAAQPLHCRFLFPPLPRSSLDPSIMTLDPGIYRARVPPNFLDTIDPRQSPTVGLGPSSRRHPRALLPP